MNPIGALILVLLVLLVMCASRRWAALSMVAGVLFLTQNQQLTVGGFNMFALRFLELAAFARVMTRREFSFSGLNKLDRALLLFYVFVAVVFSLREGEGFASMIGLAVDAFLCYFAFRGLIHDTEDLHWFLSAFLLLLAPFAAMVVFESLTQRNLFAFVGGGGGGWSRGDRFRSLGSFRSPTLLGTFGAVFLPLYMGLAFTREDRTRAWIGIILCASIVWASNSGGPISSAGMAVIGWLLWLKRLEMRTVRRLIVAGLVVLALVMKAPIWYLLERISHVTGGDGHNRAYMIDISVQNLGEWWFAGMPIAGTINWFPYSHPLTGGADITNQFIAYGLSAGLGAIVLFILLLKRAFSAVGHALAAVRSAAGEPGRDEVMLWGLGVVLCVHIASWFGITYFDQIYVIWFMQLAAVSSISVSCAAAAELPADDLSGDESGMLETEDQFAQELS